MTVIKFPGEGSKNHPATPVDGRKMYFVCLHCDCVTFIIRPGYVIECANCRRIHSGDDMAAWQLDKEPEVPEVLVQTDTHLFSVDFDSGDRSMERFRKRLDPDTTGFIIHATTAGDVHTWGKIEGRAQNEWMARQLQTAIRLLSDADAVDVIDEAEAEAEAAAKRVAEKVMEPDLEDWITSQSNRTLGLDTEEFK